MFVLCLRLSLWRGAAGAHVLSPQAPNVPLLQACNLLYCYTASSFIIIYIIVIIQVYMTIWPVLYIYIYIYVYIYIYIYMRLQKDLRTGSVSRDVANFPSEPRPCYSLAETALQPLIWCSESLFPKGVILRGSILFTDAGMSCVHERHGSEARLTILLIY